MIRMSNNVLAFAEQYNGKDLIEAFVDYYSHYQAMNGKKDLTYNRDISFSDKEATLSESIRNKIVEISGVPSNSFVSAEVMVGNPMYRWATFAVIGTLVDMVIPDTIIDSVGLYTETKVGGFGDNFTFDIEPNDLFYVTKAGRGGRHAEAQKSFNGQVAITPEEHDISVQVNLYRVLSGKESLAAFVTKAVRSIETEMAFDCYTAFDTAMAAVPSTTNKELYYSGFSQDKFIELTDKVTSYNNGNKAVVVGTRTAVSKILPSDTNYRMQIESDYVKIGYIREFFGVDVVVIPQKANWKDPYQTMLDDTRLYVMSPGNGKIVKLAIEGSTITIADETYANAMLTQQTTMKKNWKCGIATNATFGMIELS